MPNMTHSFSDAVRLHQQGNLPQAEEIYHQLIAAQPREAGALHMLGGQKGTL
jgi:hypothetical protein